MIVFNCPQCKLELRVKPEHAGQSGNCRHCGTKLRVPLKSSTEKAAQGTAAASTPVEHVEFESVQGFDDIASGIAEQYDPEEAPVEKEEDDTTGVRRPKKAAAKEGPRIKPIFLLLPVLLAMAVASWLVFMPPVVDEPITEIHRLPQKDLAQAMNYLTNESLFPNVAWVDARPDEGMVVVGWRRMANIPGGEVPPKRVVDNAAMIASDSLRGKATVYLVDAERFTQTWTTNQGGIIDEATAEGGIILD